MERTASSIRGARDAGAATMLLEASSLIGGTASWSGGAAWIPLNARMREAGLPDSREAAATASLAARIFSSVSLIKVGNSPVVPNRRCAAAIAAWLVRAPSGDSVHQPRNG